MSDFKSFAKIALFALVILLILGYSLFEARGLVAGPVVDVWEPQNGESFPESLIKISGQTKNISFLSLNDSPISIDEKGIFQEKFLLSPGYNIIKLTAQDRFGREKVSFLELMYNLEKQP